MKMQELNLDEMKAVNGGGLFSNNDSSNAGGLSGTIGIGNLLSYESYTKDGDEETWSSGSVGNDLSIDLGSMFNSLRS